jgi:hypothetical protein
LNNLLSLNKEEAPDKSLEKIFLMLHNNKEENENKYFGNMIFFPLKALFQSAYMCLSDEDKKNLGFTGLSTIKLRSLGKEAFVNIGELFVELSVFQKWYFENFTKYDVIDFSYGDFIKKICDSLIPVLTDTSTTIFPLFKSWKNNCCFLFY